MSFLSSHDFLLKVLLEECKRRESELKNGSFTETERVEKLELLNSYRQQINITTELLLKKLLSEKVP
jgi:hypothetical protein